MNNKQSFLSGVIKISLLFLLIFIPVILNGQQKIVFGLHADPVISWFSSDIKQVKNVGARPGFNFGLTYNKYFTSNYSFSTGISLLNAGGRLVSSDTVKMDFSNFKVNCIARQSCSL